MITDDAKEMLAAMTSADGMLLRGPGRNSFRAGSRCFHDDDFRRWALALEELLFLSLVDRTSDPNCFELTTPGTRSGVMMLSAAARQRAQEAALLDD